MCNTCNIGKSDKNHSFWIIGIDLCSFLSAHNLQTFVQTFTDRIEKAYLPIRYYLMLNCLKKLKKKKTRET